MERSNRGWPSIHAEDIDPVMFDLSSPPKRSDLYFSLFPDNTVCIYIN